MNIKNFTDYFGKIANFIAEYCGSSYAFLIAVLSIAIWLLSGSYFEYSNTWQLVVNTGTTIVTFLLGFLILNTANRAGKAEQLKLDEIIRALETANNNFVKLEEKTVDEVGELEEEIRKVIEEKESEQVN